LLTLLVSHGDDIVSRQSIFKDVWGFHFDPGTKRIEVQLNYLRKVLRSLDSTTVIETHRGKGLRLYKTAR
jgi:DNA-binding response OmpR family regulator